MTPLNEKHITCPDCKGKGSTTGRGCPGFKLITLPCQLCKESGTIGLEQQRWIKRGAEIRKDRMLRGYGIREDAKRRGITASHLCDIERGRINNDDFK